MGREAKWPPTKKLSLKWRRKASSNDDDDNDSDGDGDGGGDGYLIEDVDPNVDEPPDEDEPSEAEPTEAALNAEMERHYASDVVYLGEDLDDQGYPIGPPEAEPTEAEPTEAELDQLQREIGKRIDEVAPDSEK